jgi:putative transposase
MLHLMRVRSLQKFAAIHASIHKHLSAEQGFYSRSNFKLNRAAHQFETAGELRFFRIHLTARNTLYTQS